MFPKPTSVSAGWWPWTTYPLQSGCGSYVAERCECWKHVLDCCAWLSSFLEIGYIHASFFRLHGYVSETVWIKMRKEWSSREVWSKTWKCMCGVWDWGKGQVNRLVQEHEVASGRRLRQTVVRDTVPYSTWIRVEHKTRDEWWDWLRPNAELRRGSA